MKRSASPRRPSTTVLEPADTPAPAPPWQQAVDNRNALREYGARQLEKDGKILEAQKRRANR